MGSLRSSGPSVTFTAGNTAGAVDLFVNATLGGITKQSSAAEMTIVSIDSVTVSPSSATLDSGVTQLFTANPTCSAACPSGITYTWALNNNSMGTLDVTAGQMVNFTAGPLAGTVTMWVNATLDGKTVSSSVVITIPSPASGSGSGPSDLLIAALLTVPTLVVLAGAAILFLVLKRKKGDGTKKEPSNADDGTKAGDTPSEPEESA
jgi:hypothetical protein